MKAEISEMSMDECRTKYEPMNLRSLKDNVVRSQICARDEKPDAADSCQGFLFNFLKLFFQICSELTNKKLISGDSGSPLQLTVGYKYYLCGLSSFGLGCGSNFPSIYTRISSYIDWIEDNVWPEN